MLPRELFQTRNKAREFDITTLLNPTSVKEGLLCVSASTWELAYSLIAFYGRWRGRYYWTDPGTGAKMEITDGEWEDVLLAVDLALEELQMSGCQDIVDRLEDIALAISQSSGGGAGAVCGCDSGTKFDDPPSGDLPGIGPGQEYTTEDEYLTARCNIANLIVDDLRNIVNDLYTNNIDTISEVSLGAGLTMVIAILATAGIGTVLLAVLGLAAAVLTAAVSSAVDLVDIVNALDDDHDDLICAIYGSSDPDDARDRMKDIFVAAGLTGAERALLGLLLPNVALNKVFKPSDPLDASYEGTFDCSTCDPIFCEIDYEIGTGTFVEGEFYDAGSNDPGAPDPHIVRWETRDLDPDCVCLNNVVLEIGATTIRTDFTVVLTDCEGTITNPLVGGQLVEGQIYGPAAQLNITAPQAGGAFTVNVAVYKTS